MFATIGQTVKNQNQQIKSMEKNKCKQKTPKRERGRPCTDFPGIHNRNLHMYLFDKKISSPYQLHFLILILKEEYISSKFVYTPDFWVKFASLNFFPNHK
ncbi:hypothetical protein EGW08_002467 [Elysia chlorotica]|uniref:Uncharacterized protein n=1 Tax=Elysia chlorotica TaxID=188477 RepID=A0A433U7J5_ELYCH|nr:hypothetical protein EGW08_002467 [Elysia chlorotica]